MTSKTCKRIGAAAASLWIALVCISPVHALPAQWTTVAPMLTPAAQTASVLLPSGKVLVVGGLSCCTDTPTYPFGTPQLFDPATGSWSFTGPLANALTYESLTVLHSGKVLVVGGYDGLHMLADVQIYDPSSDSWSSAASLHTPRAGHAVALLASGKVLVAGGYENEFVNDSASAELYDPDSDTWQVVAGMSAARIQAKAVVLQSGKVLVAGGVGPPGYLNSAEVFDPQTLTWSATGPMSFASAGYSMDLLPNASVLLLGGFNSGGFLPFAQVYDSQTNGWLEVPGLRYGRSFHGSTLLPTGQILVTGGENSIVTSQFSSQSVALNTTEIYDPQTHTSTYAAPLHEARMQHDALLLPSGVVFVSGGALTNDFQASAETIDSGASRNFASVQPARLLDTRPGWTTSDGLFNGLGKLGLGGKLNLSVANRGGLPASGIGAVVLNVTVVNPTAAGYLTIWPADGAQPTASNLNFTPGQTTANLVIAKASADGKVTIFNSAGTTDVIADVVGWFPATSGLTALNPARVLDTRAGSATIDHLFAGVGAMRAGSTDTLAIANRGGVPFGASGTALLNVTATDPTAPGYLTVWPQNLAQPYASNLNFVPGQTVPNFVFAQTSNSGQVSIYNSAGSTDVIADIVGWLPQGSELTPVTPCRLLDTRSGMTTSDGLFAGSGALPGPGSIALTVAGRGGVPAAGVGTVVLNVTVTNPTATGYLTAWPSGAAQPNASNLNFVPGQTVANLVIAKVGADGAVALYNSAGSTDVVADIVGWFP